MGYHLIHNVNTDKIVIVGGFFDLGGMCLACNGAYRLVHDAATTDSPYQVVCQNCDVKFIPGYTAIEALINMKESRLVDPLRYCLSCKYEPYWQHDGGQTFGSCKYRRVPAGMSGPYIYQILGTVKCRDEPILHCPCWEKKEEVQDADSK